MPSIARVNQYQKGFRVGNAVSKDSTQNLAVDIWEEKRGSLKKGAVRKKGQKRPILTGELIGPYFVWIDERKDDDISRKTT